MNRWDLFEVQVAHLKYLVGTQDILFLLFPPNCHGVINEGFTRIPFVRLYYSNWMSRSEICQLLVDSKYL